MAKWLLIDGNCFCHRARHSTGSLEFDGEGTGVAFGVLRAIEDTVQLFQSNITILAFDSRKSHRKRICPGYKNRYSDLTPKEVEEFRLFHKQIDRLKSQLLPLAGYRNIIESDGYEADDIIAQFARDLPDGDDAVIASSDKDLWQCLRWNVECFNPITRKIYTENDFWSQWGISPNKWAVVKALAGCQSDTVEGIEGVGEKSAAGYFSGELMPSKNPNKPGRLEKIEGNLHFIKQNLPLVKLPFPGLVLPAVQPDQVTEASKMAVMEKLGASVRRPNKKLEAKKKQYQADGGFDL